MDNDYAAPLISITMNHTFMFVGGGGSSSTTCYGVSLMFYRTTC